MGAGVLIVDDHAGFRAMPGGCSESEGYRVVGEAADGASGFEAARELAPSSPWWTSTSPTGMAST